MIDAVVICGLITLVLSLAVIPAIVYRGTPSISWDIER